MKRFLLPILFFASTAFAQSTPDWRPINRVYKDDAHVVGSVGSAGQIKAGHVLTTKSFPAGVVGNDKLAFWNLASASDNSGQTSCTSGAAACDLTNNGTVTFTGSDIFGSARVATFNGTTQSLSSTDAFFNPGNGKSFAFGGWFYLTSWTPASANSLVGFYASGTDKGPLFYVDNLGIMFVATNTATLDDATIRVGGLASGWHHVVMLYDQANTTLKAFVDGRFSGSSVLVNQRALTSPAFRVGANGSSATNFMNGSAEDVFFINCGVSTSCVSDQDIRRLYSTRLDHNKNLIAKRQDWQIRHQHRGIAGNPYQKLPFVWMDTTDSNSLFLDLADLDSDDRVDIRLYDLQQ